MKEKTKCNYFNFLVLCDKNTVNTFECYYCNDEQGYYCPQPFPSKYMFSNNSKYHEQMKNVAFRSSNNPLMEPVISCFVRKMTDSNHEYRTTHRGSIKSSMNDSMICQSTYRLPQNPNYPG